MLLVNRLFAFFQPAPIVPQIEDPEKIDGDYRYWRTRVFYSMFIGYAIFYLTRKSFTFAMPFLINDLGFSKGELGILGTVLSLTYGLSKLVNGVLGDRTNARTFMAVGLILTGIFNIFFGFSSSLFLFAIFWAFNGWFQGLGWPPCARLLTHWYSRSERGSWWSMWNISHNVGGAIIPVLGAYLAYQGGWRMAMFIPGIIAVFTGIFLLNRLRDTPESLGLPPIDVYRSDMEIVSDAQADSQGLSARDILVKYILTNPLIWMLAVASFLVYIVRMGVNDWTALFLVETKSYSAVTAGYCVSLFEIGGFFGSLVAGFSSDYFFEAKRGPVNAIFAFGILFSLLAFWWIPPGYPILDGIAMFFVGFSVFGPQMLIGVAAAEFVHKKAAASSTGFLGWFAYAGAATAGWPLGAIAEQGWDGFFVVLITCSALSLLVLLFLWNAGVSREEDAELATELVT